MKTMLRSQFYFPTRTNLTSPPPTPPSLIPFKTTSHLKHPTNLLPQSNSSRIKNTGYPTKQSHTDNAPILGIIKPRSQRPWTQEFGQGSSNGYSRIVIFGAVSIGVVLFLMGIDEQKALAMGPEGPLMEEFWDNMRRYALYALTVSTGVAYAVFQPILELLKNPISAVLIVTIIGVGSQNKFDL
ncbi:hypothetical protein F0562_013461 [Nyssa sinensis]|uniref:Uncharacterized protein ycf33 n=1 Tax=Nyssa sinensis TaxID=561372 RepID=A0A5J4ZKR2_9ASTE|nr:hypothetical protein F0562_013461 [Nyssa sinensis]